MSLNIKLPVVHELARELAERTGTSMTSAIEEALRARLSPSTFPLDHWGLVSRSGDTASHVTVGASRV